MSTVQSKRILLVTRNLPPLVGGMERLNWHLAQELSRYAEVRVIGPFGAAAHAPAGIVVDEVPLQPLWKFLLRAQVRTLHHARDWKPGWVLAGSGLTAPLAWLAARAAGSRAAAYVHGLDLAVQHPVYRVVWLPALRRMDRLIANSQPTAVLAERAGIKAAHIGIVHPGVTLPTILPDKEKIARFRVENGLADRPILLSIGRLSERKGLREFVAESLPRIVAARPDVLLLIVGGVPKDSLYARAQTPDSIRMVAEQAGVAGHVRFLGVISNEQLEIVYRAADVHVFPVREIPGNPEGFGMVAVEAAAHGVPTVAFVTGGVTDAVAEGESGQLVPPGNYAGFAAAVCGLLDTGQSMQSSCICFARRFAWPRFGERMIRELLP